MAATFKKVADGPTERTEWRTLRDCNGIFLVRTDKERCNLIAHVWRDVDIPDLDKWDCRAFYFGDFHTIGYARNKKLAMQVVVDYFAERKRQREAAKR